MCACGSLFVRLLGWDGGEHLKVKNTKHREGSEFSSTRRKHFLPTLFLVYIEKDYRYPRVYVTQVENKESN